MDEIPNFEIGGMLCRLQTERQNGVSDCTDDTTLADLAAVLAALHVEQARELMTPAVRQILDFNEEFRNQLDESQSRIAALEKELEGEREANARLLQRLEALRAGVRRLGSGGVTRVTRERWAGDILDADAERAFPPASDRAAEMKGTK